MYSKQGNSQKVDRKLKDSIKVFHLAFQILIDFQQAPLNNTKSHLCH